MRIKRAEEKFFKGLMMVATLVIVVSLFMIIVAVVKRGLPAMNWDMVSKIPGGGFYIGKEGGLLNAIVGSLYIVLGSITLGWHSVYPLFCISTFICPRNQGWHSLHACRSMFCLGFLPSFTGHLDLPSWFIWDFVRHCWLVF
jgi:hypothetical protein